MAETYTEFLRCQGCSRFVEKSEMVKKQRLFCPCGGKQYRRTVLSKWEVFIYLLTHPSVLLATVKDHICGSY